MLADVGETVTPVTGMVLVIFRVAERAVSWTLVHVTVDTPAVPGASNLAVVFVNCVILPPPDTDHVTAVFVAFVVVPVSVLEVFMLMLEVVGLIATDMTLTVTETVAVCPAGSFKPPKAVAVMVAEPE
jgi:hypothetical protein